ncbi:MAG: DUF1345 domain-containing protein [Undibacterium sp.]|nr:DUF1345 domain-containing protein [Undibacterium sp.]
MRVQEFFNSRVGRLAGSLLFGFAAVLVLPDQWSVISRLLVAWNLAIWLYFCLMLWLMIGADHAHVSRIAKQEDRGAFVVLVFMLLGAIASIAALVWELASIKALNPGLRLFHYGLTGATVLGSWALVGMLYTFHYARLYYSASPSTRPLKFPDDELSPDYWDFLYFSFTISVAAQTSDIAVQSRSMRRTVLVQSILSFLFNIAVLGFSINIAASLIN